MSSAAGEGSATRRAAEQIWRIAVSAPYYTPAVRAGGPVPGVLGVVHSLTGQDVHVFTGDRDLGEDAPYPPPHRGTVEIDGKSVTYLAPPRLISARAWLRALRTMHAADILYLNSCFSAHFTILPLGVMRLTGFRGRVVISPRGELAPGALRLGRSRLKKLWLPIMRWLTRPTTASGAVVWLASSEHETEDIRDQVPGAQTAVCPEMLREWHGDLATPRKPGDGPLRVISVGRLAPIKGTLNLIEGASRCTSPVDLTLVGPAEDADYVARLHAAAADCPDHVKVIFTDTVPPDEVRAELARSDLFISLTQGENFGHAIGEALQVGLPAIITDRTPWSVATGNAAVTIIPLDETTDPTRVAEVIDAYASKTRSERQELADTARGVASGLATAPGSRTLLEAVSRIAR